MKKLALVAIATLFLATGAQAEEPPGRHLAFDAPAKNVWHFNDYKKCTAHVEFTLPSTPNPKDWLLRVDGNFANDTAEVVFDRTNLAKLEAAIRFLKKASGRDVGVILIEEGLAVPFKCGATSCPKTPKPWC